ncbi:QacE family quaternary ammonium compound efflux SMR transporter [Bremerella cremea]|uniref:Guanidinium exporter n=1 Tax=Bremerella cremea TaxID=1031537 RepID=A0A368KL53_9BACT|nr:multidrug efflux SMR transporter [Bremerella cremea]RCS41487.1 QacE family quaternary ammonium compound efflux SMR transporter [Bremerella cremea]
MAWWILLLAGSLEIVWAVGLKYTQGFTRPWPSAITLAAIVASMYLLSVATKELPIGTAYAVWVGIGAAGTAILGMAVLNEPVTVWRLFFLVLLGIAIVGLKFSAAPA